MEQDEEDDMWNELEQQELNRHASILGNKKPEHQTRQKTKPLKVIIFKKLIKHNKFSGNPFTSWTKIPGANFTIVPGIINTEKDMCRFLLRQFGTGEYLVQTWHHSPFASDDFKKNKYTQAGKKRKKSRGFFTFWKGYVQGRLTKKGTIEGVYERYSGNLLGYLKASIPVGMKHLF